ncbi:MAG: hypothetical protein LBG28_10180 [Tannerella sp.]|jgi:hypothetical protein|nr:hypothetical protein [Tannerella sp.]
MMKKKNTLSVKMMNILQKGIHRLSDDATGRIGKYIESRMTQQDLFMNKSGEEDIYYTAFGWMLSYLFGIKIRCEQARRQLQNLAIDSGDLIQYAAYIRSKMLLDLLNGNYGRMLFKSIVPSTKAGKTVFVSFPHNDCCSPYSTFIRLSLLEDMNCKIRNKKEMTGSLAAYRVSATGGYSNIAGNSAASVNATSAALSVIGQLEGYALNDDVDYLYRLQDDSGGFYASENTPLPDVLSTATALFVLNCYGITPRIGPMHFIEAHWLESGSFAPTLFEETSDIEYTFYGLLALGTC